MLHPHWVQSSPANVVRFIDFECVLNSLDFESSKGAHLLNANESSVRWFCDGAKKKSVNFTRMVEWIVTHRDRYSIYTRSEWLVQWSACRERQFAPGKGNGLVSELLECKFGRWKL